MLKVMPEKQPNSHTRPLILILTCLLLATYVNAQAPEEYFLAGCADILKGNYQEAVNNLSAAITRSNANEQFFLKRGEAYLAINEFDNAIEDFNEAEQIIPGVASFWLAKAYALSGDHEKAIAYLTVHLKSDFRKPEAEIRKDPVLKLLVNDEAWYNLWQHDWYGEDEKTGLEVDYYLQKGLYAEAISYVNAKFADNPSDPFLYATRGKIGLLSGNLAAAIADYSAALNLDKMNPDYYAGRGEAYLKAGRYKDALNDFSRLLKTSPERFDIYLTRSRAYAGMESYDLAIKDVLFYLKYFENNQPAIYQCGMYYFQTGDFLNALKYFNKNLLDDPNNSMYYKARGMTYVKTGTYKYAINDLAMSLDLNPMDGETYMYMGIAKLQTGKKDEACSDFEKARELGENRALQYTVENCR
jgi:tetratricopeptide (TPR) repeat protein